MTQQSIDFGATDTRNDGETLLSGFTKVEANFDELYALVAAAQTVHLVFAGPTTGSAAAPTFRELVAGDIPEIGLQSTPRGLAGYVLTGNGVSSNPSYQHPAAPSYTVAGLPAATTAGQIAFVSNETGGAVLAFADGTNWRRVTDRAIVS